jgi:methylated-DNA-[protein]-cysteine S-methyltransferase
MLYTTHQTPIGLLTLAGDEAHLTAIGFPSGKGALPIDPAWRHAPSAFEVVILQLDEYFAGRRRTFDLRLAPRGTDFQRRVWAVLQSIPWGATWSYRQVACAIGNQRAVRAVGLANASNPLPIVIPCHRVIGSNGALTGFGGGLATKAWLLAHEGVAIDAPRLFT